MLNSFLRLMERLSGALLGGLAVGAQVGTIFVCVGAIVFGPADMLALASV